MSDIPRARRLLQDALTHSNIYIVRSYVSQALLLMKRKQPDFRAHPELAPLSPQQKRIARDMRARGCSLNHIVRALGTNIGRVSEAINE